MNIEDNGQIKDFLEQITGTELSLKKAKLSEEDYKRELFEYIINEIERANNRSLLMETDFGLNSFKYDELFHEIIGSLLVYIFGENPTELIYFYLYKRQNTDGSLNPLLNENNEIVPLNNPTDLWILLNSKKPKKRSSKNA
jgi:hypothetical protein